jgi:hypothetical protein
MASVATTLAASSARGFFSPIEGISDSTHSGAVLKFALVFTKNLAPCTSYSPFE